MKALVILLITWRNYNLDEKNKSAILTDIGIDKIEKYFKSIGVLKNNNFYLGSADFIYSVNLSQS